MSRVEVRGLRVELEDGNDIVDDISFSIDDGELLGVVGESGSGKTTLAVALLGHARRGTRIAGGTVEVDGRHVLQLDEKELARLRGGLVSYVPQDPAASLNPALRIGLQLEETLEAHGIGESRVERADRISEVMAEVKLPADKGFLRKYPHQLSGGQQQRVVIAMAFICHPKLIVLDEPTTGLDVTTQAHVLETISELSRTHGVASLYVTHDLAVIANIADRVRVMYAGRTVEHGTRSQIFEGPAHPYTRKLLEATPDVRGRRELATLPGRAPAPGDRPSGCPFHPRCPWRIDRCELEPPPAVDLSNSHISRCFRAEEVAGPMNWDLDQGKRSQEGPPAVLDVRELSAFHGHKRVLEEVSLSLRERECLALVGESGSGKTTLARCIAGLHAEHNGEITYLGDTLAREARKRPAATRRSLQFIFQSPYNSLNPRKTIEQIIGVPLRLFFDLGHDEVAARVEEALERVALGPVIAGRYPDQLSGGERQRVAIARALACEPDVLICDEITSALDVCVQASIVNLIEGLQREEGLSMLFVTHNLALVRSIADRVVVMDHGQLVEEGPAGDVIDEPAAPYTRKLLADTPTVQLGARG
jgi:peptide/nickel transport system ATP-binding protein